MNRREMLQAVAATALAGPMVKACDCADPPGEPRVEVSFASDAHICRWHAIKGHEYEWDGGPVPRNGDTVAWCYSDVDFKIVPGSVEEP